MWYCVICKFAIVVFIVSIWLGVPMLLFWWWIQKIMLPVVLSRDCLYFGGLLVRRK